MFSFNKEESMKTRILRQAFDQIPRLLKSVILSLGLIVTFSSSKLLADTVYVPNQGSNTISLIDTTTNTSTGTITGLFSPAQVIFSPDGKFAYVILSSSDPAQIAVINTATQLVTTTLSFPTQDTDHPLSIAITPDGTKLYVGTFNLFTDNTSVGVYNLTTNTTTAFDINSAASDFPGVGMAITPDGTKAYVSDSTFVYSINTATNVVSSPITVGNFPRDIAITPSGTQAWVTNQNDGTVSVINTATNLVTNTITLTSGVNSLFGIAISPDGQFAYVAEKNNLVRINTTTFTTTTLPIVSSSLLTRAIAITSDSKFAYVDANNNTVTVVDLTSYTISAGPITVGSNPSFLAIGPSKATPVTITPPSNLTGVQKKNDFGILYELFNVLKWQPGTTIAASFNIYRNGVKIATVDGTVFKYEDHDRKKGVSTTYSVTAVSSSGAESTAITVVVGGSAGNDDD
jgi:YVTN family beta-propeller protein